MQNRLLPKSSMLAVFLLAINLPRFLVIMELAPTTHSQQPERLDGVRDSMYSPTHVFVRICNYPRFPIPSFTIQRDWRKLKDSSATSKRVFNANTKTGERQQAQTLPPLAPRPTISKSCCWNNTLEMANPYFSSPNL